MELFLRIVLINTATASLLALAVALIGLALRRPAVMHVLWLIVLIKLFTPPLVEVETLPSAWFSSTAETVAFENVPATAPTVTSMVSPPPASRGLSLSAIGVGIWFTGAASILLLALWRTSRFQRFVADSPEASPALLRRASTLARRIGLAHAPQLRLIAGQVSPMLWHAPGGCVLLLPQELLQRLDPSECDAVLAHELAHLQRRDHWVRWIEFAAGTLFWWHPLVWWTRRQLRIAEEKSCDALVLRALPGQAGAYAEGLLKTLEYLAGRKSCTPALATGADETRHLSERLTMILNERLPRPTPVLLRWLVGSLALAALLVFPTWAERDTDEPEIATREAAYRAELTELRRQTAEVERELERLSSRRIELERAMHEDGVVADEAGAVERELHERLVEMERMRAETDVRSAAEASRHARELERAVLRDEVAAARKLEARIAARAAAEKRDLRADDLRLVREELVHQIEILEESSGTAGREELQLLRDELRKVDAALHRMR